MLGPNFLQIICFFQKLHKHWYAKDLWSKCLRLLQTHQKWQKMTKQPLQALQGIQFGSGFQVKESLLIGGFPSQNLFSITPWMPQKIRKLSAHYQRPNVHSTCPKKVHKKSDHEFHRCTSQTPYFALVMGGKYSPTTSLLVWRCGTAWTSRTSGSMNDFTISNIKSRVKLWKMTERADQLKENVSQPFTAQMHSI